MWTSVTVEFDSEHPAAVWHHQIQDLIPARPFSELDFSFSEASNTMLVAVFAGSIVAASYRVTAGQALSLTLYNAQPSNA